MTKYLQFFLLLTSIILVGCQEKTKTKTVYQNGGTVCVAGTTGYYTNPTCQGYKDCQINPQSHSSCLGYQNPGTTVGGTTGGYCQYNSSHPSYFTDPSCTGYQHCLNNPQYSQYCSGYNGGGTNPSTICTQNPALPYCQSNYCGTSGTIPYGCMISGGTRINCYLQPTIPGCSTILNITHYVPQRNNPNYGVFYPGGIPNGSCSSTYVPTPLTSALDTRKGTVTMAGAGRDVPATTDYNPLKPETNNYLNTSDLLKNINGVKSFYLTDAILKARIKVKPEIYAANTNNICSERGTGSYLSGYTKLKFKINIYGVTSAGGAVLIRSTDYYTTSLNNCTPAIDLSQDQENYPHGVFIAVMDIWENKNCTGSFWTSTGYTNCSEFNKVRSAECLQFEIEVAADGTKTFD